MTDDLENLEKKLAAFKTAKTEKADRLREADNMNTGLRAGAELVACIGAGGLIGWGLDKWLETQPLFLIIFLLSGIGAAFMNIYKITQNAGDSVGFRSLQNQAKDVKKAPEKED